MYKKELVTIRQLFEEKLTSEKSPKALRARADEKILVFVAFGDDGHTRLYDKQLSVTRALAARSCKNRQPKLTWGIFQRTFEKLDAHNQCVNDRIIALLNDEVPKEQLIAQVAEAVFVRLREDGISR